MFFPHFVLCCCFLLPAGVLATGVDGGHIQGNERDTLSFCREDLTRGLVMFSSSSEEQDERYDYVITTATSEPVILELMDSTSFDFRAVALNEVRVYAISYTGAPAFTVGFPITLQPLSDECYELSDNYVTIFNGLADGLRIGVEGAGDTAVVDLRDPGELRVDFVVPRSVSQSYLLALTDTNNVVRRLTAERSFEFSGADAGLCRVWGIAVSGTDTLGQISHIGELEGRSCVDVSDNFILIHKRLGTAVREPGVLPWGAMTCFPNPAVGGEINFGLPRWRGAAGAIFRVYDVRGQQLHARVVPPGGAGQLKLSLGVYPPGIYLAVLTTPGGRAVARFIVP